MKGLKIKSSRVLAAVLAVTMLCSGIGTAAFSAGAESVAKAEQKSSAEVTKQAPPKSDSAPSKAETVYVIAKADGTPEKIIVSDWIKNTKREAMLADVSNLKDIENVKGDEKFTFNSDNSLTWEANGNDIYYRGTGTAELPVDLSISCTLDGKKLAVSELAGKSGKLTLRFDYNNKQYEDVKVNGKTERIYVPFVMLTGTVLDNEKFSNIEVSNGKVLNDGSKTYVAGFACPKLGESLDIQSEDFELPEYVEITADVRDFELSTTLTLAINDIFSDVDFSKVDNKVDELSDSLSDMTDAANKLIDGSSALYDGLNTLLDKTGDLTEGAGALYKGAKELENGAAQLDNGAASLSAGAYSLSNGASGVDSGTASLQGYISELNTGLSTLSQNSSALNSGAEQVFNSLLQTADTMISAAGVSCEKLTIENYGEQLNKIIGSLTKENAQKLAYAKALETVTATVNSQSDVIEAAVEAEVKKQVTEGVLAALGNPMSAEQYEAAIAAGQIPEQLQAQVSAVVAAQMESEQIKQTISANVSAQKQKLIDENMQSEQVLALINEAVSKADDGRKSLSALKTQLDSYNQFYNGVLAYTAGVESASAGAAKILGGTGELKQGTDALKNGAFTLKNGADTLKNGTGALKNGAEKLTGGAKQLSDGTKAFSDGVLKLKNGSQTLSSGLKQFKKEGVDALVEAVDGDVKGLVNRLKAISKVSSNYKSYSGIAKDTDGKTDFIYKTAAIEK